MAKRKAARAKGRKAASARAGASRKRAGAKKKTAAARKATARRTPKKAARKRVGAAARSAKAKARKAPARKSAARKTAARKAPARKAPARAATARKPPRTVKAAKAVPARKAPSLDRARRTVGDEDDLVPTPPSSLDLDRRATAVRTGRREMVERFNEHTETSPALTAGDIDADWESAYSVGDEAPGGDNPTPDQDIVDDIGRAVGVEYQDNEELKGADKLTKRDKHRWELDPASAEDYDDRD